MTDFQEKIQTGILTLCFHSRHLTFMGLVVIKGLCAWLGCELKFSAVCVSFHSCNFMLTFFLDGWWECAQRCLLCSEQNFLMLCVAQTTPSCFLGNQ